MTATEASALLKLLRERHPTPRWASFSELRSSNGFDSRHQSSRYLDFAAFDTWPSGDSHRIAYEVKVRRSDFVRELEHPGKRRWAEDHFHDTYFVAPHGLLQPDEMPEGWGLLQATKTLSKLRRAKLARQREPKPLSMESLAMILRTAATQLDVARKRCFMLDGMEVTPEQLQVIVSSRCSLEAHALEAAKKRAERESAKHERLTAPIGYLHRLAGQYGWHGPEDGAVDVESLLEAAVAKRLAGRMRDLEALHERIGALLSHLKSPTPEGGA